MTDFFALFGEPRRPWLDPVALKQKFLSLSAEVHPDKLHLAGEAEKAAATKSFAELNAAHNCLAEPKSRLLHLLELELGNKPPEIQQIPAGLADLFAEVAMVCGNTDRFLAERNQVTSPLLRVQFFERGQGWVEKLNAMQQKLNELQAQMLAKLKSLDEEWMGAVASARRTLLTQVEQMYRLFSYFNRWNRQIQERVVQLTL